MKVAVTGYVRGGEGALSRLSTGLARDSNAGSCLGWSCLP